MAESLVDQIYEAAAVPDLWPALLDEIARLVRAEGATLFVARQQSSHVLASPGLAELVPVYFQRGYQFRDERTRRLLAERHAGFLCELDVFSPEEWEADPIRREFWAPHGLGWGAATQIETPSGESIIVHFERRAARGPYERAALDRLDALRPHLARASLLSSRLAFERARSAVAAMEMLGLPAAMLDPQGRLYAGNGLFDAMLPEIFIDRPGGIRLAASPAAALFTAGVRAATTAGATEPCSIPVHAARPGQPPLIVHLLPVRGAALDIFSRAGAILVVTPVTAGTVPGSAILQGLFDLTPAEARVARAIGLGETIAAIARRHGVREVTVRNQLHGIFAKTGTHRQADLAGLLRGALRSIGTAEE